MFEYDRLPDLALDVRRSSPRSGDGSPTRDFINSMAASLCVGSSLAQAIPRDPFDCGSSSGYGSPGGTPLASPQSAVSGVSVLPIHVQRAFREAGFAIDDSSNVVISSGPSAMPPVSPISTVERKKPLEEAPGPAPTDDGLSFNDIKDFEQLLCSPKKQPPNKYQCHICYQTGHYISDCPQRFNSAYDELTPYQGRKKCYGEFQCQQCKRKWTSQNSVANEAQSCIKCHVAVFPHKQLPVEKAVSLGLIKAQKMTPTKLAPIGHGRPPASGKQ